MTTLRSALRTISCPPRAFNALKTPHGLTSTARHVPLPAPSRTFATSIFRSFNSTAPTRISTRPVEVEPFYHSATGSWSYLVVEPESREAVVIDPVLDFDLSTATISSQSVASIACRARKRQARVVRILETHVHADHLSGARVLRDILTGTGGDVAAIPIAIGAQVRQTQQQLARRYGVSDADLRDAFDEFLHPGDIIPFGNSNIHVHHLPGHTSEHLGYQIGKDIFVGDVIFMPDVGTARTDFAGGSTLELAHTLASLTSLPGDTRLHVGHDYPTPARQARSTITLDEQLRENVHLKALQAGQFVEQRERKNRALTQPKLAHPSLQFNIAGGRITKEFFVFPPVLGEGVRL